MRKLILSLITAITIPALALAQAPDAKAKAEEILKKARAAIGDEKKLKELQGLSIIGTARVGAGDNQRESELEIEVVMPDKVKKTTSNQFLTITNTLNGDVIWNDFVSSMGPGGPGGPGVLGTGWTGPLWWPRPGRSAGDVFGPNSPMGAYFQLQQRREFYQIMLGWLLTTPASAQVEFAFIGEAPGPEGSKLNVLDGKGANGFTARLYFDQQTNQLIGLSYKAKPMGRGFGRGGSGGPGGPGGRGPGGPGGPGGGPGGQALKARRAHNQDKAPSQDKEQDRGPNSLLKSVNAARKKLWRRFRKPLMSITAGRSAITRARAA